MPQRWLAVWLKQLVANEIQGQVRDQVHRRHYSEDPEVGNDWYVTATTVKHDWSLSWKGGTLEIQ